MTKNFLGKDMAFGGGGVTWFSAGSEGEWPSSTKYSKEKTKEKQGQGNFVRSHSMIVRIVPSHVKPVV